jgi:predicted pyridoxine 5'-phosphate oxidase superfamily flavin-nucleotide-binding protein
MGVITEDMRRIVGQTRLCFAATVNADGTPNLSPKSSLMVYDDDHLVFANIASPGTVRNLRRNPAIEINAVDIFLRRGYRFKGTGEIKPEGTPEYDFVATPFWADNGKHFPIHEIVKVRVARAAPLLSPAYTFIEGCTEDALRTAYHKKYGVRPLA